MYSSLLCNGRSYCRGRHRNHRRRSQKSILVKNHVPTLNNPQYREGQRWLADNEPGLGLGTLIEVEFRQLTLIFPATGETRIYASENPPLTRIAFSTGDRIKSDDQWEMVIERIDNDEGYLTYHGARDVCCNNAR